MAHKLGIPNTLQINRGDDTNVVVKRVRQLFSELPDITMECSGVEACINIAIIGTKEGGKVGLIGLNHNKVSVQLSRAAFNELELIGVRRYKDKRFRLLLCIYSDHLSSFMFCF